MNNSGTQLKTENFMVFDSYTLLPNQQTIKQVIQRLHLEVISDGGKDQQCYFKFSNERFLFIFMILVAHEAIGEEECYSIVHKLMGMKEDECKMYMEKLQCNQLSMENIKLVHKALSESITKNKGEYAQIKCEQVASVLLQLKKTNKLQFRQSQDAKERVGSRIDLIIFNNSNYYVLAVYKYHKAALKQQPTSNQMQIVNNKGQQQQSRNSLQKFLQKHILFVGAVMIEFGLYLLI